MASHAPDFGRASALPLFAVLGAIPSYPRPVIERLVAKLIEHLDEQDGDPDAEANGDELDGSNGEDEFLDRRAFNHPGAGCPLSDPGEDEHDTEPDGRLLALGRYGVDQRSAAAWHIDGECRP